MSTIRRQVRMPIGAGLAAPRPTITGAATRSPTGGCVVTSCREPELPDAWST